MTIAPPPSEPSGFSAIVASASSPTATNASQPNRSQSSFAPRSAGTRSSVSSRFETPKKRLVSSGPIGASESVDGCTAIDTA